MDSVRSGPFGQIFRPDNFVFGKKILNAGKPVVPVVVNGVLGYLASVYTSCGIFIFTRAWGNCELFVLLRL